MKKFLAFILLFVLAFSAISCEKKSDLDKEPKTPSDEENVNEGNEDDYGGASSYLYHVYDMETFLHDVETDPEIRAMFLNVLDHTGKVSETAVQTLLIPTLKSEQFRCVTVYITKTNYAFHYLPSDNKTKHFMGCVSEGGFEIRVTKGQVFAEMAKRYEVENNGDYFYYYANSYHDLFLNQDEQAVDVLYNPDVLPFDDRAALEEVVVFERYDFNENGLCKETGKNMEERAAQIQKGMTYAEVKEIMGCSGKDIGSDRILYYWFLSEKQSLTVGFQGPSTDRIPEDSFADDYIVTDITIEKQVE